MELEQKYKKLLAFVVSLANEVPSDPAIRTASGIPEDAARLIREITDIDLVCRLCGERYRGFHQC